MKKKCKYCGYEGATACEGLSPRMGCEMPGLRHDPQPLVDEQSRQHNETPPQTSAS